MAHKSKTQRAKASVAKANKKDRLEREEAAQRVAQESTDSEGASKVARAESSKETKEQAKAQQAAAVKKESKPKKSRFQFLKDVRSELKHVTWPSRQDVIRWSGVVVGALLFFGIYIAILDNLVVTPALIGLSGLGA